jgi:hypothetical protein
MRSEAEVKAEALEEASALRPEWQAVLNREDDSHFASGSMHGAGVDVACDVFQDFLIDRAAALRAAERAEGAGDE